MNLDTIVETINKEHIGDETAIRASLCLLMTDGELVLFSADSGYGKTHLLRTLLKVLPPVWYASYSDISMAALRRELVKFYEDGTKIVAIDEISRVINYPGMRELLKSLHRDSRLTDNDVITVTERNSERGFFTQSIPVPKITVISTMTNTTADPELLSRATIIPLEQIDQGEIVDRMIREQSGEPVPVIEDEERDAIRAYLHSINRNDKVTIHLNEKQIANLHDLLSAEHEESDTRKQRKFYSIVRGHALLNKRSEANDEDVEFGLLCLRGYYTGALTPGEQRYLDIIEKICENDTGMVEFTAVDIKDITGEHIQTVRKKLHGLTDKGRIVTICNGRGKPHTYRYFKF